MRFAKGGFLRFNNIYESLPVVALFFDRRDVVKRFRLRCAGWIVF